MVIFSHYLEWGASFAGSGKIGSFVTSLGDWGVGIFFFLSGYALYKGYGLKETDRSFIMKRLCNTYIPYLVIALCIAISSGGIDSIKSAIRLLTGADYWFIFEILIIYLAFYLVGKLPNSYRVLIMTIFVIELSLYFLIKGYQAFWYTATWPFAVGLILAKYEIRLGFVRNGISINIKDWVLSFLGKLSLYIYVSHAYIYHKIMAIEALDRAGLNWYIKLLFAILVTVAFAFLLEFILNCIYKLIDSRSGKKVKQYNETNS